MISIKNIILSLINKITVVFFPKSKFNKKTLRYLLYERSIFDSLDFISQNMEYCQVFETREALYKWTIERSNPEGMILEFGVHNGHSINAIAKMTDKIIHGFDSFEGLPDDGIIPSYNDGAVKWYKGKMNNYGLMPKVEKNVILHKGWFEDTLPIFYKKKKEKISIMHIDCDIYSSTKTIFNHSISYLESGSIIIFDEYLNYEGWQKNEHRALIEFASKFNIKYEFIAYSYLGGAVIKLI